MESNATFYVVEVFLELAISYRLGYKLWCLRMRIVHRCTFLYRLNMIFLAPGVVQAVCFAHAGHAHTPFLFLRAIRMHRHTHDETQYPVHHQWASADGAYHCLVVE